MPGGAGAYAERMRAALSLLADACCVLVFVVIGRASHSDGETLYGLGRASVHDLTRDDVIVPDGFTLQKS